MASERKLELEAYFIKASTEEEGLALTKLLACCLSWKVRILVLSGQVGQAAWEGVARAADRGFVCRLQVDRNILKSGTMEDARRVYECTDGSGSWWVAIVAQLLVGGVEIVWRREVIPGSSGWGEIERLMTS